MATLRFAVGTTQKQWIYRVLDCLFAIYLAAVLYAQAKNFAWRASQLEYWSISEFLVNYQEGFVRRGLFGEILFKICAFTQIDPRWIIVPLCILASTFVIIWFFGLLRRYNLRWWILTLSFCIGCINMPFLRKDMFVIAAMGLSFWLISNKKIGDWTKLIGVTLLDALLLLFYEPTFFIFIPLLSLLIFDKTLIGLPAKAKALYPAIMAGVMALLFLCKGDTATAQGIDQSWRTILPDLFTGEMGCTIESISWTTDYALRFNRSLLTPPPGGYTISDILSRFLMVGAVAYILRLYPYRLTISGKTKYPLDPYSLTLLIFITLVSLSPMLLGLSCDYDRIMLYLFCVWLIVPRYISNDQIKNMAGARAYRLSAKVNKALSKVLPSSTFALLFVMLTIGVSAFFRITEVLLASPIGLILKNLGLISIP